MNSFPHGRRRWRSWRLVLRKPSGRIGLVLLAFVLAVAVYGLTIDPYPPRSYPCFPSCQGIPPFVDFSHPFGAYPSGHDVFSEIAHGAPIDLMIGFGATSAALLIGTMVGILAGYFRGIVRDFLLTFIQVFLLLPSFVILVFYFRTFQDTNLFLDPVQTAGFALLLGVFSWPPIALVVRSSVTTLRQSEFVASAKMIGAGRRRVLFRHILPNVAPPAISVSSIVLAANLAAETLLVYLGLVPTLEHQGLVVTWGVLLFEGKGYLATDWWIAFFPGLMIVITVLGFALLGDALSETLNPRLS